MVVGIPVAPASSSAARAEGATPVIGMPAASKTVRIGVDRVGLAGAGRADQHATAAVEVQIGVDGGALVVAEVGPGVEQPRDGAVGDERGRLRWSRAAMKRCSTSSSSRLVHCGGWSGRLCDGDDVGGGEHAAGEPFDRVDGRAGAEALRRPRVVRSALGERGSVVR